jgi:hypothetical protein
LPLLSFSVLKDKLLDGSKTQTIRYPRKNPLKVEDKLYVYWKCRTKETEKLGESKVLKITTKTIGELDDLDAIRDGFDTNLQLIYALTHLHKNLSLQTKVDIITFTPLTFEAKDGVEK